MLTLLKKAISNLRPSNTPKSTNPAAPEPSYDSILSRIKRAHGYIRVAEEQNLSNKELIAIDGARKNLFAALNMLKSRLDQVECDENKG